MEFPFALSLANAGIRPEVVLDLQAQGLTTPLALRLMSDDELDTLRSINNRSHPAVLNNTDNPRRMTLVHVRALKAYRYTLILHKRNTGTLPPATLMTPQLIDIGAQRITELSELRANESLIKPERPPPLKDFNLSKWIQRWRAFCEYLQCIRGSADIPLT